jgi:hypothetical protein
VANLAEFTINASPSDPRGYDASHSEVLTFALEGGPASVVQRWTLQVYDAAEPDAPLASKDAPTIVLNGATAGQKVDAATPGSNITSDALTSSGAHSWIVRSLVNGGLGPDGQPNSDYVFERMVVIRSPLTDQRKIVPTEGTQYSPRGWADAQNDQVDAEEGNVGAGETTSTDATPETVETFTLAEGYLYKFGVECVAYGTAPGTTRLVQEFLHRFERLTGAGAVSVEKSDLMNKQSSDILGTTGLTLEASGNDVLVRWTGHATIDLRPQWRVGYTRTPVKAA